MAGLNKSSYIARLEKINEILDLCIDQELYDDLEQIVTLSTGASKSIDEFRAASSKRKISFFFHNYPIQRVEIPLSFIKFDDQPLNVSFDDPTESFLLRHWSNLFWAKMLRAEIKRQNKEPWLRYYEDLIVFIETSMPAITNRVKEKRTAFAFLMELSACAVGEASYGYAERARGLLKDIIQRSQINDRLRYGHAYDRWIWFNMGLAYQHIGLHQKAVLEFNRVISKFWKYVKDKNTATMSTDLALEFLLNIIPAIQQRASINLRLQLGYHALQTFKDENGWLDKLEADQNKLFNKAAKTISKKKCVVQLEALLQLDQIDKAEKFFNDKVRPLVFPKATRFVWSNNASYLPPCERGSSESKVRLIEETVRWFLEKGKILRTDLNERRKIDEKLSVEITSFINRLTLIESNYWKWVKDNSFDERVYFSRWAQSLRIAADIWDILKKKAAMEDEADKLLEHTLRLYLSRRNAIPVERQKREETRTLLKVEPLQLENLRSDDLPDFVEGLKGFYKTISQGILRGLLTEERLEKIFETSGEQRPMELLKGDHFKLLNALDEYEREFSERQLINCLKMCNDSLIWLPQEKRISEAKCKDCLKPSDNEVKENLLEKFNGLLSCDKSKEIQNAKENLLGTDYDKIMKDTEEHLTKHLETPSLHDSGKNALHFLGLQRWNSLTPAQGRSVGGGYFIYRTDENGNVDLGIAIDPGFDFVRNFFRMGFSLKDIDIVLISHAHADHLWDFESMIQLLNELEQKKHITHRLNVILTLGSYKRLEHVITSPVLRRFLNPLVIDIRKELDDNFLNEFCTDPFTFAFQSSQHRIEEHDSRWKLNLPDPFDGDNTHQVVRIRPTFAYHDDFTMISDGFGFIIEFPQTLTKKANSTYVRFGYTGDTKWVSSDLYDKGCPLRREQSEECWKREGNVDPCWRCVASQYYDSHVILMHLGSLIDHKNKDKFEDYLDQPGKCEDLIREKNHPYLMGIIRFIQNIFKQARETQNGHNKLILIGEFGEELRGGIRADLAKRLEEGITKNWPVVPIDVGLDVVFHRYNGDSIDESNHELEFEFLCAVCENHRPIKRGKSGGNQMELVRFGQDEAIFYLCNTCFKATPVDVTQNRLRQLYEIGKELKYSTNKERE